jgi:fervidolysin-like protein
VPVVALLIAAALASAAKAGTPSVGQQAGYVPDEVIVKFRPGLPAAQRSDVLRDRGATLKRPLPLAGTVLTRIPSGDGVKNAVDTFERDPRVAWAEPNAYRHGGALPNDRLFEALWGVRRIAAPGRALLRRSRRTRLKLVLALTRTRRSG